MFDIRLVDSSSEVEVHVSARVLPQGFQAGHQRYYRVEGIAELSYTLVVVGQSFPMGVVQALLTHAVPAQVDEHHSVVREPVHLEGLELDG